MIKVRKDGKTVDLTGKDQKFFANKAKEYGLSMQHVFTGMLWEAVMRMARQGYFKKMRNEKA